MNWPIAFALVNVGNLGHARATDIKGRINVTIQAIPSMKTISQAQRTFGPETLDAPDVGRSTIRKEYTIPGLTVETLEKVGRIEAVVRLEGNFTYNDGFDESILRRVCMVQLGWNNAPPEGVSLPMFDCDEFPGRLEFALKRKRENQETNKAK